MPIRADLFRHGRQDCAALELPPDHHLFQADHILTEGRPKTWKEVTAAILDFLLAFLVGDYLIALLAWDAAQTPHWAGGEA